MFHGEQKSASARCAEALSIFIGGSKLARRI